MSRDINPKCKQCRRAGEKLFLKGDRCQTAKCSIVKRNYAPGFHGPKGRNRSTDFGLQLKEKQKARKQYGMTEKQFGLYFQKAKRQTGNVSENFIKLLETRLDNVIYRLGLGASRFQARQMVNHGHFIVNNHKVSIPSYIVKTGDIIKIKPNKSKIKLYTETPENLKKKDVPGWLNFNLSEMTAKVVSSPDANQLKTNFNMQMIIEYYSK